MRLKSRDEYFFKLQREYSTVITVVSSFTYINFIGSFNYVCVCLNKHGLRFISFLLKSSERVEGSQIVTIR